MTSVSEKYSSHLHCSITATGESFCYTHMHTEETEGSDYLKRVHECTQFLFHLISSNYFSPPVVDNLRAIIDRDQKKFKEGYSLLSSSKPIEVIAKYKRARTKDYDGKGKHLKFKDGVLTCSHFIHPEKNYGGRSTIELVSLVKRHETCISEIKEEFHKLKDKFPALSEVQVLPWQSDEIELNNLQIRLSRREDAGKALTEYTGSSYFVKGNPSPNNLVPKEFSPPTPLNSLTSFEPKESSPVLNNRLEGEEPKQTSLVLPSSLKVTTGLIPLKLMSNPSLMTSGLTPFSQMPLATSSPTPFRQTPTSPLATSGPIPFSQMPSSPLATSGPIPFSQMPSSPLATSGPIPFSQMPSSPLATSGPIP
ncbi:hypothetical protein [Criblamydia sequanensis]|uniref:Uncharacterized protein n=1 Tax=Candidatus Criblamydia sequanensis CRIB-18 TaxID=1437425 RepID=A0A090D3C8_9BACT|nr:hypothetical protein [Criblamydia sequanensis]CDR35158.1 hypothetical protein CSEC_2352 [Criblamydia sequanensis CRIB-18]